MIQSLLLDRLPVFPDEQHLSNLRNICCQGTWYVMMLETTAEDR